MSARSVYETDTLNHGVRCPLANLNDDVYSLLLRELPTRDSLMLSMTCRTLREALMPMLFGRSFVSVRGPLSLLIPEVFTPASLRPYVQYVKSSYRAPT